MFYALSQSQIKLTWIEENIINYNAAEGGPSEMDRISHYEENSMSPQHGIFQAKKLDMTIIWPTLHNAPIYIQVLK